MRRNEEPSVSDALPIDTWIDGIRAALDARRAVVVTAAPGAGKTTRVPPALIDAGRVLLLQPRRVAARAIAQRIAAERGWTVGREVGWHVRFDRRESPQTQLLVATEGILTSRLQQDPLLSSFRTVVLDEFHERSIHSDLGLALVKQAWLARDDLRIVVMSATIDAGAVSRYLDDCPVVDVPGRLFPVDVGYRAGAAVEDVVAAEWATTAGALLVFLPGAREIARVAALIAQRVGRSVPLFELHGSLDADRQDAALVPSAGPRVVLATNIAETTLTVPDVRLVVDAGWQKIVRYDAGRGLDSLETERVSADAAEQRAGRAGRVGPGRAIRLWDEHTRLRAHRQPEIDRIDLAGPVLDVLAWGTDPRTFDWFAAPPAHALAAAMALLHRLGAVDDQGRLTDLGRQLHRLPLHPRLGRLIVEADGSPEAALAVALLSERRAISGTGRSTACDLWSAIEGDVPPQVRRVARDVRETLRGVASRPLRERIDEAAFRRAVLAAYPDRVGRRRAPSSDRVLLASGAGARIGRESGVVHHEFLVAVDAGVPSGATAAEALIRVATGIEREWLEPQRGLRGASADPHADDTRPGDTDHWFDPGAGVVRAQHVERYGEIVLRRTDVPVDAAVAATLMTEALLARGPDEADRRLLARLAAAGVDVSFGTLVRASAGLVSTIDAFRAVDYLPAHALHALRTDAPADLLLPSGRRARLEYRDDGRVMASVKLQELFGLAETPRVAGTPVTFELLAPNGRPVQVTTDLKSFWSHGYQEVRKELRARYPRHPWPEDPWTAQPTHRTVRR